MTRAAPYGSAAWRAWKHDHHWGSTATVDPLGAGNTTLISALGVTPFAFYDRRKNLALSGSNVTSLKDVKGDGTYGPTLAPPLTTNQPTWDGSQINFSGGVSPNNQYLVTASTLSALDLSTQLTFAFVGTLSGTGGKAMFSAGNSAFTAPFIFCLSPTTGATLQTSDGATGKALSAAVSTTQAVLLIGTVNVAGTALCTIEIPGSAKVTGTGTPTALASAALLLAIGAETNGVANAGIAFRAFLAWSGGYTTGQRDTLKTWATTYHGVTLQ